MQQKQLLELNAVDNFNVKTSRRLTVKPAASHLTIRVDNKSSGAPSKERTPLRLLEHGLLFHLCGVH